MPGYSDNKDAIRKRLRRIEGQVRGAAAHGRRGRVLHRRPRRRSSAATKALQAVALELLDEHLAHCVADAIGEGGAAADAKVAEASAAIARLVRS